MTQTTQLPAEPLMRSLRTVGCCEMKSVDGGKIAADATLTDGDDRCE